jgi:serine/threonine-protein kinase
MGSDEDRRLGQILANRYKVVELISSGGMGAVYRGERLELGRQVAIKFLHGLFRTDKAFRGRFDREAKAMSRLSHPFCVSVIDFGVDDVPYIVMDFVTGFTLRDLLKKGPIGTEHALRIAGQILTGLAHAHGRSIIHRDIKPENIMLSEATGLGEHVRIFDFGLAKIFDGTMDSEFSTAAAVIGTPSYMSPEQSFGETVDHTTDLYSTGVVLFEMLTGQKPFQAEDATEVIRMHRVDMPPQLSDVAPDVDWSPNLEAVLARALNKRRELRFQTADEFAQMLASVPEAPEQSGVVTVPPRSEDPDATTVLRPQRKQGLLDRLPFELSRRAWFGVAGAALGAVVVVLALVIALATAESGPGPEVGDAGVVAAVTPPAGAEPKPKPEPEPQPEPQPASPKDTGAKAENPEVKIVREMIAKGKQSQAIQLLQELRGNDPNNAHYAYLLGNIFFDKKYHSAGVDRYAQALELDPGYRTDERLIRDLIDSLSGTRLQKKVRPLLVETIGDPALPFLQKAAQSHENLKVRLRAAAIAGEISE